MRIGLFADIRRDAGIDALVETAREANADGLTSLWMPQIFGLETTTALAIVGREVPDIELGTAVIPIWQRHPQALAIQALTTNLASGNRFTLGIGLLHRPVVEGMLGMSFDKPVRRMREYLSILLPLLAEKNVSFGGEALTYHGPVEIDAEAPSVMLAALGTQMLHLAARETDGTITWMTGPKTLETHVSPTLRAAAEEAGRPAPRIVAALPVTVTDDVAAARERAARNFEMYGVLPSYRAMLDREGAAGPADVVIAGTSTEVADRVGSLGDSGVTDFAAVEFGSRDERAATREVLRSLL